VCYLTLCERSYPKKLAYQYLEELQREFEKVNRSQIETVARPYAFIKFGTLLHLSSSLGMSSESVTGGLILSLELMCFGSMNIYVHWFSASILLLHVGSLFLIFVIGGE